MRDRTPAAARPLTANPSTPPHRSRRRRSSCSLVVLAVALLGASTGATADRRSDEEARLRALRDRITTLDHALAAKRDESDRHEVALREAEKRGAVLARELHDVEDRLAAAHSRLERLHTERARAEASARSLRAALATELRAAYAMGRQDVLKVLLEQESPDRVQRILAYHGYLARARSRRLAKLRDTLAELDSLRARVDAETRGLETLRAERAHARDALASERDARRRALVALRAEIKAGGRELDRLRENERRLQKLVDGLARELADIPRDLDVPASFAHARGTLPWPVPGPLERAYGTPRDAGNLSSEGVLIGAPAGTPVHAVFRGRIAYADWLRGFGLLVIIDHGDGYMSLYGHNESLYAEVGDWVEAGDVIARVGDTGGSDAAGLYFEIRHRGRPSDPAAWCRRPSPAALVTPENPPVFLTSPGRSPPRSETS